MKMSDSLLIVTAVAAAAALVLLPRRASAAPAPARNVMAPTVGGAAGDLWTDARTAQYREQLAREMAGQTWYGP